MPLLKTPYICGTKLMNPVWDSIREVWDVERRSEWKDEQRTKEQSEQG